MGSEMCIRDRSSPDLVYLVHVAGWDPYHLHDLAHVPGLDLYYADPAQPRTTAGQELDDLDLDHDQSDVRNVPNACSVRHLGIYTGFLPEWSYDQNN